MLKVENLTSYYSNIKILKNLSFNLKKGKVLCLLGRNGAGKTTTLKSLMGLVDKTEGKIIFNDKKISGQFMRIMKFLKMLRKFLT